MKIESQSQSQSQSQFQPEELTGTVTTDGLLHV